jgi:hypothetical protein
MENMEKPWKIWKNNGKTMQNQWKIHGKSHNMKDSWGILVVIR